MRPLVVLILVLGAIAALLFALTSITGDGRRGGTADPMTVVKPTDTAPRPTNLVDPAVPPNRSQPVAEEKETRQAVQSTGEARGAFAGAIEGLVVDEEQKPISEVRVSLMNAKPSGPFGAINAMRNQDPP